MEIAFELIREAGLRVPSPIGPTIGIVGALILGGRLPFKPILLVRSSLSSLP